MVHAAGGLAVVGLNPISLSVLRDPGSYGADVVVGEGQPLGVPMNFGGPHMGIFAVKDIGLARSMPGRLIGMTTTKDGSEKAFCMVLQTREQHIRREAATSNICTNQALLALAAAAYMSLLGKNGFRKLGEVNLANAHYAAERIGKLNGVKSPLFSGPFFNEFTVGYERRKAPWVFAELAKRGVMGGYPLDGALLADPRGGRVLRHRGPFGRGHRAAGRGPRRGDLEDGRREARSAGSGRPTGTSRSSPR